MHRGAESFEAISPQAIRHHGARTNSSRWAPQCIHEFPTICQRVHEPCHQWLPSLVSPRPHRCMEWHSGGIIAWHNLWLRPWTSTKLVPKLHSSVCSQETAYTSRPRKTKLIFLKEIQVIASLTTFGLHSPWKLWIHFNMSESQMMCIDLRSCRKTLRQLQFWEIRA